MLDIYVNDVLVSYRYLTGIDNDVLASYRYLTGIDGLYLQARKIIMNTYYCCVLATSGFVVLHEIKNFVLKTKSLGFKAKADTQT